MKNTVFEYIVVYAPVDVDENPTKPAKIVKHGVTLAKDSQKALINIGREIPEEYMEESDFVDILIRPF